MIAIITLVLINYLLENIIIMICAMCIYIYIHTTEEHSRRWWYIIQWIKDICSSITNQYIDYLIYALYAKYDI